MKLKSVALLCLFIFGHSKEACSGTLTGVGGDQIAHTIAGIAIGGAAVGYSIVTYGYAAVVTTAQWIKSRGEQKRLKKERKAFEQTRNLQIHAEKEAATLHAQKLQRDKEANQRALQKHREQQLYQSRVQSILKNQEKDLHAYYNEQQDVVNEESACHDDLLFHTVYKRSEALSKHLTGNDIWQEDSYQISYSGQLLLKDHSIPLEQYNHLFGNKIQRVLHQEYVDVINRTAEFCFNSRHKVVERQSIANTITQFAHVGQQHNHAGYILKSFEIADFCHGLVAISEDLVTISIDVGKAVVRGVKNGGYNLGCKLVRPDKTIVGIAQNVKSLIITLANITDGIDIWIIDHQRAHFIKVRQDEQDVASGRHTRDQIRERDDALAAIKRKEIISNVKQKLDIAKQAIDYQMALFAIEKSSEIASEALLSGALCKVLSSFVGKGSMALGDLIDTGGGTGDYNALPFNATNFSAVVSYEAVMAQEAADAVRVTGAVLAEAIDGAAKVTPIVAVGSGPEELMVSEFSSNFNDILNLPKQINEQEILELMKVHDGSCEYNGLPIKFSYDHNWNGNMTSRGKLGGIHHELLTHFQDQGLIKDVQFFAEDFYTAKLLFKEKWVEKSFFPKKWKVSDVMQSVKEAIRARDYIDESGNVIIIEFTRPSGIAIRVVLDKLTGVCHSFYPRLK